MSLATAHAPTTHTRLCPKLKVTLLRRLVESLDLSRVARWDAEKLRREVRAAAARLAHDAPEMLSLVDREDLAEALMAEAFGLGPIEPYMSDPSVSDILVNGPGTVFLERDGRLERADAVFADDAHLTQIIQRIASRVGRRVDESSAMVDARLADGSRVNAIIPPLALDGPVLSIRRFGVRLRSDNLIANGTLEPRILDLLRAAVEARVSLVISGGTGGGKTTLLNTLSRSIPADERLVTIEDSAELKLQQPHVVRLETRPPNLEGAGEVRARDLVRNSLRMRPDRVIVGEVRGPEALDMLQAMNTGHEGSMTTVHANDTRDALGRLEMMVVMAGFELPLSVIRHQIGSAIGLIVHVARLKGGARRVMRVSNLVGVRRGRYVVRDLFEFRQTGVIEGVAAGAFHATGKIPSFLPKLEAAGVTLDPEIFEPGPLAVTERGLA